MTRMEMNGSVCGGGGGGGSDGGGGSCVGWITVRSTLKSPT